MQRNRKLKARLFELLVLRLCVLSTSRLAYVLPSTAEADHTVPSLQMSRSAPVSRWR